MKKWSILIVLAAIVLCLSGCSNNETGSSGPEKFQKAGNIVTFGRYEQDNKTENGPEPIQWVVLDVQDGKALLFSKYILDGIPYNEERKANWEESSLRGWLNNDFLSTAFDEKEQAAILVTEVDNGPDQGYSDAYRYPIVGNNTEDKLFLLSYREMKKYLPAPEDETVSSPRHRGTTEYALTKKIYVSNYYKGDGRPAGSWYLRTCHDQVGKDVDFMKSDGTLSISLTYDDHVGVCPAFWIDLNADYFK